MSKIKASEKESKQEKTTNAKKVNTSFWYSGNHIIKIWEQYLKSIDQGIKFYNNNQSFPNTLFAGQGQLSQSIEHVIVTKTDGTPYKNHYGESITICGELSQVKKSELPNRLKEIIDQINSYNATQQDDKTKITHHTIIFPYQPIGGHWNLGKITFDIKGDKAEYPIISLYEPYGPKYKDRTDKFLSAIKSSELFSVSALGDTAKCQQQKDGDGTSCGAITAENGKEFLIAVTKNNTPEIEQKKGELLKKTYAVGAYNLRKDHIDEIDGIDGQEEFLKVQLRNQSYNSNVDKKNVLENHKNVKSLLESTIQKETYSWVSDLLRHMQTSKDSSDEVLRTKLELFRGFIMHHDLDQRDEQSYISPMLLEYNKGDLEWKTGAMELIDSLNIPNQPANSNKGKSVKTVGGAAVGKEDKSQKPNPKTDEKKSKDKKLDIPSQQDKKSVDNKSLPDTKIDVKSKNVETGSITPTTVLSVKKSPVNAEDLKHKLEEYSNKIKDEVKIQQVDSEISKQLSAHQKLTEILAKIDDTNAHPSIKTKKTKLEADLKVLKKLSEASKTLDTKEVKEKFGLIKVYQDEVKDNPLSFNKPSVVHFGIDAVATKTLQGNVLLPGKLHPIEEGLLIKALNKLEASIDKESYIAGEKLVYPNNVVLIDIFPRKADVTGLVNRIGKEEDNDNTEVHTVVLWKFSGSKIILIDPTKKGFSSFLEGTYSSQSGKPYEVISGQSDNTQLYSDGGRNKGYSSYEDKDGKSKDSKLKARDCTDIAVKIAFELNEKQHNGQQSSKTLSSLTVENIKEQALEQISNKKVMDNGLKSVNTRALQSSKAETRADAKKTANDFIELKSYFLDKNKPLEKIFNYNDKTLREIAEINQLALELKALPPESLELLILEEKKEEKTEVKKEEIPVPSKTAINPNFPDDFNSDTEGQNDVFLADFYDSFSPINTAPYSKPDLSMFHNGKFGGAYIPNTNADSDKMPMPDYNEGYNGVKYAYSLVSSTFNSFFEKLYMAETKKIVDNIKTLKLNKKTLSLIDDAINSINELGEGEYQYAEGFNPKFGLNTLVRLKEKFKKLFDDVYKKVKNLCEEGDAEQLEAFLTQNTFVYEMLSHNEGELGTIACQLGHSGILKLLYQYSGKSDCPISDFSERFLQEAVSSYQVSCVKFLLSNGVDFNPILKKLLQLQKGKLFKEVEESCDIADLLQRQESIKQELINHLKTTSEVDADFYQGWLYYQNESYKEALKSFEGVESKKVNADMTLKLNATFYGACCAQYLSMSAIGADIDKYKNVAKNKFILLRDACAEVLPHLVNKIGQHIDSLEGMSKTDAKVDGLVKTISKNTLLEKHSIVSNDDFKQKVDDLLISRSDFQKAKSLFVELQNSLLNAKFVKLLKVFPEAVILWDIFKDVLDDETFKEKIKFSAKEVEQVHVYSEAKEIIDNALEIIGEIASGNVVEPIEFIL